MKKVAFARMTKVNEASGEFWAEISETEEVRGNEIFDYDLSKPLIKAWSDDIHANSGGKSYGNLRAMHNPKLSAGILPDPLEFDDAAKTIRVHGQVIDPGELEKLTKGCYTGVSFGGDYGSKKVVGGKVRYAAKPVEISLADLPMGKNNRFMMVKATGEEVEMEFQKAAAAGEMQKGLSAVANLADLLQSLQYLTQDADWEAKWELDNSPVVEQLKAWLQQGGEILRAMAAEEVDELLKGLMTKAAEIGELGKVGAAMSAKNLEHAQAIHDHAAALGATCEGGKMNKVAETEALAKVADLEGQITAKDEELAKVAGEKEAAVAQVAEKDEALAKVAGEKKALQKELDELKAQPAPAKGAARAVTKEEDADLAKAATVKEPETPLEAIKAQHQKPFILNRNN